MGYAVNNQDLNVLNTDMYQLTMMQAWFNTYIKGKDGAEKRMHEEEAVYYAHWRKPPEGASYTCVAGLEEVIDYLDGLKFDKKSIQFLREQNDFGTPIFSEEFLHYLENEWKMELDVDAVPEGEVMLVAGPVVRLKGPRSQGQLVESLLLQILNSNSKIATRASEINTANENQPLINMSLRRAANPGPGVSRSAHIGGATSTACVYHANVLGIPAAGTMAHAFMMSFQKDNFPSHVTQLEAFEAYMKSLPTRTTLLVDTYTAESGIRDAIQASKNTGVPLKGIRLDSGDIYGDAWLARDLLDEAVKERPELFGKTVIIATDGLSPKRIADYKARSIEEKGQPFPVTVWGVGTLLGNPGPMDGGVYKICATLVERDKDGNEEWQGCMKIAGINKEPGKEHLPTSKASIPGVDLDVLRLWKDGKIVAEIITDKRLNKEELLKGGFAISLDDNESVKELPAYDDEGLLLVPVFRKGKNVFEKPAQKTLSDGREVTDLDAIRQFHIDRKNAISPDLVRLIDPRIQQERIALIAKTREEQSPSLEAEGNVQGLKKVAAR